MEFKGTKGKWSIEETFDKKYDQSCININVEDHIEGLATIWSGGFENCEQTKSDALLISKAPEMLEMLKKLVESYKAAINGDFSNFSLRSEIDNANELIKQATTI